METVNDLYRVLGNIRGTAKVIMRNSASSLNVNYTIDTVKVEKDVVTGDTVVFLEHNK